MNNLRTQWTAWNNAQLIESGILEIGDGYRAKNSEMGLVGLPFARAGNIDNGFHFENADLLDEMNVSRAGSKISRPGDVVFTSKGTVGRFAYVKPNTQKFVYSPQLCYWRIKDSSIIDPRFLFYWMHGRDFTNQVHQVKSLTDMADYVSLGDQRQMKITAPPLPTQHKIAAILSAYDDLIENNTRRITILEEMAQALYREWFVHFRFPGHEKIRMVESVLGMIPEGWEVKSIGDIVITLGGGTPSTKDPEYWDDGDVIWYSPTDLTSSGKMFITDPAKKITNLGLRQSSARLFPAYSVMMTSRATIGVVAINTKQACTNQGFITCIPNASLSAYQIYFWLAENKEKIISVASGATFKEINRTTFRGLPIVIPNSSISQQFNEMVSPVCKEIENLITKNANLRRTRDMLLPKLISGEVDVEGLDIETGEGMSEAVASIEEDVKKSAEAAQAGEQMMLWG